MEITLDGLRFDVDVSGPEDGPSVLLLHGFPQSRRAFDAVVPRLHAAGLRTIAPDQRGYSPGARPLDVASYAPHHLVADAVGVLDALGIERAHVVGHDWGAAVAWLLAGKASERVLSLTALSVPHLSAFGWAIANDPDQQQRSRYMGFFRTEGVAEDALLADGAARLRAMLPAEQADVYAEPLSDRAALTSALNWYRAGGLRDGAPPCPVPTTFVWSTGDSAIGRAGVDRCGEHVTGEYRFVELEGVSHWIPEQAPDVVADAVLARAA
ncbi:alpha/beta fold hydrolase [Promicromonospora vindobonensis]|uniref:Alpha/beta fold hydrolase n=1 Tax=Promicromonospora vindobonensis TaxID=195748 RepID=A0ABW5VZ16_9MICO